MNHLMGLISSQVRISVARTFWQRALGLLGRRGLPQDEGLYFPSTRSVHTLGMMFAIDVVYLDSDEVIVAIHRSVKPFRISWCFNAQNVCELAQGGASRFGLQEGQKWLIDLPTKETVNVS
jgi:uncharacterized protein